MASGVFFTARNPAVFLKCGCAITVLEADKAITEAGFVSCPACDYSYAGGTKAKIMSLYRELVPSHIAALEQRCAFYQTEIAKLKKSIDTMITEQAIELAEEEHELAWILESDDSSVSDVSGEEGDYLAFESTEYALYARRLKALRERRNELLAAKAARIEVGKGLNAPWTKDETWGPPEGSREAQLIEAREARRATRRSERAKRYADRQQSNGARKVVHNVHVLGKNIPRKWRDADPKVPPADDAELKALDKKGWLTEQEQEDLDEEEQEAVTAKRREEWLSKQSKVPQIFGSVKRQRWADRVYRIARRRQYFKERMEGLAAAGEEEARAQWEALLAQHEDRLKATEDKCAARVASLEQAGRFEDASSLSTLFRQAAQIGADEIAAELEQRRLAEEAAALKAQQEAAARAKAEEKARLKAEAEARGEEWKDPDEGDEGDDDEEED